MGSEPDLGGNNTSGVTAGFAQGMILVACAWLAVMATSLISPILPAMGKEFATVPNSETLVQFTVALPALMVAIFAFPAGWLADRFGRRMLLMIALVIYAIMGLAPTWLTDLHLILVSRALVGVAEAVVMTCGTALLGDYFFGPARERWFAIQTASANIVSVVLLLISGILGALSWRTPFFVYLFPLLLFVLIWVFIAEPTRHQPKEHVKGSVNWGPLVLPVLATLFMTIAFFVVVIQLPFILTSRGFAGSSQIGFGAALAALALPIGAIVFRMLRNFSHLFKVAVSLALYVVGFWALSQATGYEGTVATAVIIGFGSGIALPTLLTWAVSSMPAEVRGRTTGFWNVAFFLGQFLSPTIFLGLSGKLGTPATLVMFSEACGVALVLAIIWLVIGKKTTAVG
jgi:MFS family permease